MSFTVTATVTVSADPAALDEDRSPATTVFPIHIPGCQSTHDTSTDVGEVVCRGALADQAREQLHAGQQIVVTGELTPRPSLHHSPDATAVLLVIEATQIGINLDNTSAA